MVLSFALVAGLFAASAASAQSLPDVSQVGTPAERRILADALAQLNRPGEQDSTRLIAALNNSLARLIEPTQARGFVQFLRAQVLAQDSFQAAREAIDESVRLLPGYSAPLLVAAEIYGFADHPALAADYILRASRIDQQSVQRLDDYEINNVLNRLSVIRDDRRIRALSDRLLEIGWVGQQLGSRSELAVRAIDNRLRANDMTGARNLITNLLLPQHSIALLTQNRYRDLWPDIERWAGPRLQRQWSVYLTEAREKWAASRDPEAAAAYVQALAAANHDDTIIRDMLPLFSRLDRDDDAHLMFVASRLAGALARKGRWNDVAAVFDRASAAWPLGHHPNALNIAGNRARFLFYQGRTAEGLAAIDAAIEDARRWDGAVNRDAIGTMHLYRACMLHKLGRPEDAATSRAVASEVLSPSALANMYLCMGDPQAARAVLIESLTREDMRADVIDYLQNSAAAPMQSEYGRWMHAQQRALQRDPRVLAAMAGHGRVLPFTLSDGAPPERAGD